MKKQSILLITGGILALASCNPDTSGNEEAMQAKVDSIVNARVEQIRMELEAKNDEYIMEMAIYRADSIMAAMSGKKTVAKKPAKAPAAGTVSGTVEVADKPVEKETVGNGKPKMGGSSDPNTVGSGKPKMGGNTNSDEVGSGKPKMGNK